MNEEEEKKEEAPPYGQTQHLYQDISRNEPATFTFTHDTVMACNQTQVVSHHMWVESCYLS